MAVKGIVGKKGELFPPKRIRETLGLNGGSEVVYRVENSRLIVELVPDILDAIKMPEYGKTTVKAFERERNEHDAEVVNR